MQPPTDKHTNHPDSTSCCTTTTTTSPRPGSPWLIKPCSLHPPVHLPPVGMLKVTKKPAGVPINHTRTDTHTQINPQPEPSYSINVRALVISLHWSSLSDEPQTTSPLNWCYALPCSSLLFPALLCSSLLCPALPFILLLSLWLNGSLLQSALHCPS